MKYEVYPEGIYTILKRLIAYKNMPKIIITESGVCYPDILLDDGTVDDQKRIEYFQRTLKMVLKAKQEHIPVEGYFVWSLTDNFEWAEGFDPRFGLVYVDYPSQRRFIKESGKWFTQFLTKSVNEKLYNMKRPIELVIFDMLGTVIQDNYAVKTASILPLN
jgi:beta-glucosidase